MSTEENITLYCEGTPNPLKISIALEELGLKYKVRFHHRPISSNSRSFVWETLTQSVCRYAQSSSLSMSRKSSGTLTSTPTVASQPSSTRTRTARSSRFGKVVLSCSISWTGTTRTTRSRIPTALKNIGR
ncbi:putative glutathione s-transferase [Ilyonectria robusta]